MNKHPKHQKETICEDPMVISVVKYLIEYSNKHVLIFKHNTNENIYTFANSFKSHVGHV